MVLKKFRIVLDGDKYFGNLLTMRLHHGGHAIKFSFKNKVGLLKAWERSYVTLKDFLFPDPQTEKRIPKGESFMITYHVEGHKLEIKQEVPAGEISRHLLEVPNPINSHLFTIHFKDTGLLSEIEAKEGDLVFSPKDFGNQIAIVFSTLTPEGYGFRDPNFNNVPVERGQVFDIDLSPLPSLKVAVVTDTHNMDNSHFLITSPLQETRITQPPRF